MKTGQKVRIANTFIVGRFSHYTNVELTKCVVVCDNGEHEYDSSQLRMTFGQIFLKVIDRLNSSRNDLEAQIETETNRAVVIFFRISVFFLLLTLLRILI